MSDRVSRGLFALAAGALAGAVGGGSVHRLVSGAGTALSTRFGLAAGALCGLRVGQAVSARRFDGLGSLLVPGSSVLIAWADRTVSQDTIDKLAASGSQRSLLRFNPVPDGTVLEVA